MKTRKIDGKKNKLHVNIETKGHSKESLFYFFTSIGNYTGESATSLKDFSKKVEHVDIKSLEFHLYRGDFEKWISETLGDKELSEEIKNLRARTLVGENLRTQLYLTVSKRLRALGNKTPALTSL